ncbi:MAG TPA: hypothetical protein VIF09_02235 [Polyangiaceae bacterium]|jgi:hypothetical protein
MRLELLPESRVLIDLQATGLLRAVGHDPTLVARPEPATLDLDAGELTLVFPVRDIAVPEDLSASDRERMLDNLRSAEVLDATRSPTVVLKGAFRGDRGGGTLDGKLSVRGAWHPLRVVLRGSPPGDVLGAKGEWEGTLTALGVKPFKALLGALKLKDWIRLRVEARLREVD